MWRVSYRPVLCLFTANVQVPCRTRSTETLCLWKARDKSSVLSCHFHMLHHTPMGCRWVSPRCSAPCWCWFDYTLLWGSEFIFQNNWLSRRTKSSMRNSWHTHWLRWVACILGASTTLWRSAAPQERYRKNFIYSSPLYSEENITVCIVQAAVTNRKKTGVFGHIKQFLLRRHLFTGVSGHTFGHCMKMVINTISFRILQCFLDFQT